MMTPYPPLPPAKLDILTICVGRTLDAHHQAALSAGADAFISKSEMPDRVAERMRSAAEGIRSVKYTNSDYSVAMEIRILNESDDSQKNRDGA